nr:AMP-binding protein [Mycobacterium sp.]
QSGATSFMVMQAALAVLLGKLSGTSDVAVGFPIAGRNDPVLDDLVGFFVNTLVLRVDLGGNPTVAEVLAQVRRRGLEAFEHQDVPFEVLVERLNPARSLTHHPLFQVALAWQNFSWQRAPAAGLVLGDVQVTPLEADTHTARWDLTFNLAERFSDVGEPAGIGGAVEFRTDVFDAATIETLIARLRRVLEEMAADPHRRLSGVDVLDASEHAQLDVWGNRAVLSGPAAGLASIPEVFAAQVARAPEAVAMTFGGRSLTYREVDEASNRLAHHLVDRGAGPGRTVALLLPRSAQAIVAILGVLKSGAAYVPMDPAHPDARISFMLADAAPVVVLTTTELSGRLADSDVAVIDLDDPGIAAQPGTALAVPGADDLAYLIYTSGTTGTPKAVAVTHHNVVQLFEGLGVGFDLSPQQVWSQFHSYAFDFSVWEIFGALLYGGRLVIVPEDVVRSPQDFHTLLTTEDVTVLSQTPSAFYALQTADVLHSGPERQLKLHTVVFGGEALEPQRLRTWMQGHPGLPRLINMYGITEITVHASLREISPADAEAAVRRYGEAGASPHVNVGCRQE